MAMKKSIGRTLGDIDVAANTSVRIHGDFFNTHRDYHQLSQCEKAGFWARTQRIAYSVSIFLDCPAPPAAGRQRDEEQSLVQSGALGCISMSTRVVKTEILIHACIR